MAYNEPTIMVPDELVEWCTTAVLKVFDGLAVYSFDGWLTDSSVARVASLHPLLCSGLESGISAGK